MNKLVYIYGITTLLCLTAMTALSSTTESAPEDNPIQIQANSLQVNELKGIATYRGAVIATQGTFVLHAEVLTLIQKEESTQLIATGDPVTFNQRPADGSEEINGRGQKARYFPDKGLLILEKDAQLKKAEDTFSSDLIRYDTNLSIVSAGKKGKDSGRVTSIIHPKKNQDKTDP